MKRIFSVLSVVAVTAAILVATAGPALADAKPNAHNCLGSFSSNVTPQVTSHNALGSVAREQGQSGTRDDFALSLTEPLSNCGATP